MYLYVYVRFHYNKPKGFPEALSASHNKGFLSVWMVIKPTALCFQQKKR